MRFVLGPKIAAYILADKTTKDAVIIDPVLEMVGSLVPSGGAAAAADLVCAP